jgi:hypothetical protein
MGSTPLNSPRHRSGIMLLRSRHSNEVNTALNDTCRIVSGCLKATPIPCLYALSGIAPPHIRRKVESDNERYKQDLDNRHPLYGHLPTRPRLPSRSSFMKCTEPLTTSKEAARSTMWMAEMQSHPRADEWRQCGILSEEQIANGIECSWPTWKSINRLRVGKGRCHALMNSWGLCATDTCDCGEVQTMQHLMCCALAPQCTLNDFAEPSPAALDLTEQTSA